MRIIAATQNKGKIKEICEIFGPLGFEVISQKDAGIDIDVEETGTTFEENAKIKARAIYELSKEAVISDDSGLCVDALNGAPGVYSARYAGDNATDRDKMDKLLNEMKNKTNRSARFISSIVMILPDGREFSTQGEVEGIILEEPVGENGFGYDPIFFSTELQKSFGIASDSEKNSISHRARALQNMYKKINEELNK